MPSGLKIIFILVANVDKRISYLHTIYSLRYLSSNCRQFKPLFSFRSLLHFNSITTWAGAIGQNFYHINNRKIPGFLFFVPMDSNLFAFKQFNVVPGLVFNARFLPVPFEGENDVKIKRIALAEKIMYTIVMVLHQRSKYNSGKIIFDSCSLSSFFQQTMKFTFACFK